MSASHIRLGDEVPNFDADTQLGPFNLYEYQGDSWLILFSHPQDFTPVCATELGKVAALSDEWKSRNVKPVALSVDSADSHKKWICELEEHFTSGKKLEYPIIADPDRKVADLYGMIAPGAPETMAGKLTVRSVFIIGPDHKLKLSLTYPAATGRNFDEILRVIDSLQLTAYHKVATPVDWKPGDKTVILPSVSDEEAKKLFPKGYEAVLPYVRLTPQPNV